MTLKGTLENILRSSTEPLTPQEIRSIIKEKFTDFYGTPSHQLNVQKGHYTSLDHALLAQIYSLVRQSNTFFCETDSKPMRISINQNEVKKISKKFVKISKTPHSNSDDLITNLRHFYKRSLEVLKDFGGPSIYFHIQAIKEQEADFLSDRHIEMTYATLASWGMHKMGDPDVTKAKLVNYQDFKNSILNNRDQFKVISGLRMDSCSQDEYSNYMNQLEKIYYHLKVSISEATIVANSKTLAHILPNLIPPIDRQYTVRFFTQNKNDFLTKSGKFKSVLLPHSIQSQFSDFKKYCCGIKSLFDRCDITLFTIL